MRKATRRMVAAIRASKFLRHPWEIFSAEQPRTPARIGPGDSTCSGIIMDIKTTILDDTGTSVIEVMGRYRPGLKAPRDQYGRPEAPDDEPSMELLDAVDQSGTTVELSPSEHYAAMGALWVDLD